MAITHEKDWGNYWQGRAVQSSGEALTGVGIEDNAKLTEFWTELFADVPANSRIADFACGAGSAIKHAHFAGISNLTGIDIAPEAIAVLKDAVPNVQGCVSPVNRTPFVEGDFDIVVSQFGFEYAGDETDILAAAREMARVMAARGKFRAIAHIKGGAIEQESQNSLASIQHVLKSEFTRRAKNMFTKVYPAEANPTPQNQQAFMQSLVGMSQAEGELMQWLGSPKAQGNEFARFGHYLVTSTREMFERRSKLKLAECLQWLDDMHHEILAYKGRMTSMINAALSEGMAKRILNEFEAVGYQAERPKQFYFDPADLPMAWILSAKGE